MGPAIKIKGIEQTNQSVEMIAVQVTDKDMIDLTKLRSKTDKLHLTAFTTIDESVKLLSGQQLASWIASKGRSSRIGP